MHNDHSLTIFGSHLKMSCCAKVALVARSLYQAVGRSGIETVGFIVTETFPFNEE